MNASNHPPRLGTPGPPNGSWSRLGPPETSTQAPCTSVMEPELQGAHSAGGHNPHAPVPWKKVSAPSSTQGGASPHGHGGNKGRLPKGGDPEQSLRGRRHGSQVREHSEEDKIHTLEGGCVVPGARRGWGHTTHTLTSLPPGSGAPAALQQTRQPRPSVPTLVSTHLSYFLPLPGRPRSSRLS